MDVGARCMCMSFTLLGVYFDLTPKSTACTLLADPTAPLLSSIRHLGTSTSLLLAFGGVGSRVPDACVSTFSGAHPIGNSFEHSLRCWAVPDMPPHSLFSIRCRFRDGPQPRRGVRSSLNYCLLARFQLPASVSAGTGIAAVSHAAPYNYPVFFFLSVFAIRLDVVVASCTCRRWLWNLCTCPILHSSRYLGWVFWCS